MVNFTLYSGHSVIHREPKLCRSIISVLPQDPGRISELPIRIRGHLGSPGDVHCETAALLSHSRHSCVDASNSAHLSPPPSLPLPCTSLSSPWRSSSRGAQTTLPALLRRSQELQWTPNHKLPYPKPPLLLLLPHFQTAGLQHGSQFLGPSSQCSARLDSLTPSGPFKNSTARINCETCRLQQLHG